MRHGPGSPPPSSARDSGGGWEKAESGRCSDGVAWAWPPREPPLRAAGLSQLLSDLDYRCAPHSGLPGLVADLGGNRCVLRRGQKTLAQSAHATPAPATSSLFRLLRMPPTPLLFHQLQSAGASLRAMHTRHSEFCVPRGLLHSLHSEFHIPPFLCPSRPLHTVPSEFHVSRDFCTPFAENSVPLEALSTLHSKVQTPDTRWAPHSIQEGVQGAYQTAWPLCSLLTLPYHPETPAQLSSVMSSLAINPTQNTSRVVGTLSFPALLSAQLAHSKPTPRDFNSKCSVLQP